MCTLSVAARLDGYQVWMNRDEQRARVTGLAPQVHQINGISWLGPVDPTAGGTWLATYANGLSVAILNRYPQHTRPQNSGRFSRGALPLACAGCRDAADAVARIRALRLDDYGPFRLVAVSRGEQVHSLTWDGRRKRVSTHSLPVMFCSSSVDAPRVLGRRRAYWRSCGSAGYDTAALAAFHLWHDPTDRSASSIMSRSDASTVSIIHLQMDSDAAYMRYLPLCLREGQSPALPPPEHWPLTSMRPCS